MLVMMAHGSAKPEWRESVLELLAEVQAEAGEDAVGLAFMDHGPPDLNEVVGQAAARGVSAVRVLPLFLSGAGHVTADIEPLVEGVRKARPELEIELLPAVGQQPLFREMLVRIIESPAVQPGREAEGNQ
jgi:sirohydrochlorin cobaltochelatase